MKHLNQRELILLINALHMREKAAMIANNNSLINEIKVLKEKLDNELEIQRFVVGDEQ